MRRESTVLWFGRRWYNAPLNRQQMSVCVGSWWVTSSADGGAAGSCQGHAFWKVAHGIDDE